MGTDFWYLGLLYCVTAVSCATAVGNLEWLVLACNAAFRKYSDDRTDDHSLACPAAAE